MTNGQCEQDDDRWDRERFAALGLGTNWKDFVCGGVDRARGQRGVRLYFPTNKRTTIVYDRDSVGMGVLSVYEYWRGERMIGHWVQHAMGEEFDTGKDIVACLEQAAEDIGLSPEDISKNWMSPEGAFYGQDSDVVAEFEKIIEEDVYIA